ncbi:MAG: hypothetical protein HY865_03845 [Chloroflexi bacterium]|nr:hypothetical protein [Chloroflexota bacterium]
MLILISCLLYIVTALALLVLQIVQPKAQYAWLTAVGGATLTLVSVFIWLTQMPLELTLPAWQPQNVFVNPILFRAEDVALPLSLSIAALTLSVLLTAITRSSITNSLTWAGTLALGGIGLLAVTADNPLTLLLVWGALDLTELVTQLRSVNGPANNERVVISFSTRALGSGLLLWANIISIAQGNTFDFESIAAGSGLYLVFAAGLRLGVLPLHLPFSAESTLRRGIGTSLRLVSAVSSLVLLAHIPAGSLASTLTPYLLGLALLAALYGGWMWLRAPDELTGRPYWVISVAALSVTSALSGNPLGAVAWGCALVLVGGSLFLASAQQTWFDRALFAGVWSLSSLPFSLTASAWIGSLGFFTPFVVAAQSLLMAGFARQALRSTGQSSLDAQPGWAGKIYPVGIFLLVIFQVLLGLTGWSGALQIGAWLQALVTTLLAFGLIWATPRLRILNPVRAHWVSSTVKGLSGAYGILWILYRGLRRISRTVTEALEGEGGIMWTLLFLALFISLLAQETP